jgi:acetyl-CoA carboxylase carboxyltransferase component
LFRASQQKIARRVVFCFASVNKKSPGGWFFVSRQSTKNRQAGGFLFRASQQKIARRVVFCYNIYIRNK